MIKLIPELIVKDISNSISFYQDNLNFKIELTEPEKTPYSWVQISFDDIKIMMQEHKQTCVEINEFPEFLSSTILLVLKFDNKNEVKKLYKNLKSKNIKMFMDIKETEYGSVEFGVLDPDNYKIIISA